VSETRDQAIDIMLARGAAALVWLDEAFVVSSVHGSLADWIEPGAPLEEALPPLVGMEDALRALRQRPEASEVIANIGLDLAGRAIPKFNLQVFWHAPASRYLALLTREITQSDLELEWRRETHKRIAAERRLLETAHELEAANTELARANEDLSEFAHIVAHDLRAPLRAMRQTMDRVALRLGEAVSEEVRSDLALAQQQARRMNVMMSGLLEFSSIGRKHEAIDDVDTRALIDEIVTTSAAPAGLTIETTGAWPVLATLRAPLDLVLRNLVSNAIKHHDTGRGRIVVRCTPRDAGLELSVSDDGPGIDPAYHDMIFEPFRTVAGDLTSESAGIGLALVRRTVEQAGGSLTVQSHPQLRRGTEFRVWWPRHSGAPAGRPLVTQPQR
jgi:signal transduction histidine kinase